MGFDNIFQAVSTAFQIVTLEGWSAILYALQDGAGFWVWPFFVLLIILGSWLSLNLVLVVVATQFKLTKRRCVERTSPPLQGHKGTGHACLPNQPGSLCCHYLFALFPTPACPLAALLVMMKRPKRTTTAPTRAQAGQALFFFSQGDAAPRVP